MIPEITATVQSAMVLNQLVKAASGLKNFNEFVAAISEVNAKLMEAQSAALLLQDKQSFLTNRISELEKEIMDLKNWEREAQRYHLTKVGRGAFAYVLKPGMESGEPSHMLCANCFNKREKSIFQHFRSGHDRSDYICHRCKAQIAASLKL